MQSECVSHVSRDPMKPSHMTNQEEMLKIKWPIGLIFMNMLIMWGMNQGYSPTVTTRKKSEKI